MLNKAFFALGFLLLTAATVAPLEAQPYTISTLAGGAPLATPARAVDVPLGYVSGIAADRSGNAYFPSGNSVFKLDQNGVLTRVAGNGRQGYSGDGGPATSAQFSGPNSVAVDGAGNLFIVDGNRVRRVAPSGIVTTVAGDGTSAQVVLPLKGPVDGVPATSSTLGPLFNGIAVDSVGNLFVTDGIFQIVRKVSVDGIITTVAGNCCAPSSADGGPATSGHLQVAGVAVDGAGNLFITEGFRVRKVSPNGIITTVAGAAASPQDPPNLPGCLADGVPATEACLGVRWVAADRAGNLFLADGWSQRVRKLSPDGIITTVAGVGCSGSGCSPGTSGDGGPATAAQLGYFQSVAVDGAGSLFIVGAGNTRIRKVSVDGIISTVAGNSENNGFGLGDGFSGDGGPATSAQLSFPRDVAVDRTGNVFIADEGNRRIRKVSAEGIITTVAGNGNGGSCNYGSGGVSCPSVGDGVPAANSVINDPLGLAVDRAGNLIIVDGSERVRKVSADGIITTVAGDGTYCFGPNCSLGDGGPATSAHVFATRVTTDGAGNLFIGEGSRIRKVSPDGIIATVAGDGTYGGFSGDGGPAINAQLFTWDDDCSGPGGGMAADDAGDLFFGDTDNNRVREVSRDGTITTVAGTGTGYC